MRLSCVCPERPDFAPAVSAPTTVGSGGGLSASALVAQQRDSGRTSDGLDELKISPPALAEHARPVAHQHGIDEQAELVDEISLHELLRHADAARDAQPPRSFP